VPRFSDPEPLSGEHVLNGFDCGVTSLDEWLIRHARAAAPAGSTRAYVISDVQQGHVVAYSAIATASLSHQAATERTAKGLPRHPIPAVLIARLAVDGSVRGKGLGAFLLRDAMQRSLAVAEVAGSRVLLVHAFDEAAAAFYAHFGFQPSPSDPLNMQMIMKDVRASLRSS
jgi:GNAT superfamily N-acetyltransferase